MNLVNKPPYMGFKLHKQTFVCHYFTLRAGIGKDISQVQYFEPLSGFCYIKKEVKQDKCLGQSNDSFCDIFLQE